MLLTIETKELTEKLELVGRVSTKHVTLPVLQCVILEADSEGLLLKATNLEIAIEARVKAMVKTTGKVAVLSNVLIQTISLINQKEVSFELKDNILIIKTDKSEAKLKTVPDDEFPSIPKIEGAGQKLNSSMFSLGIKTTAFSASVSSIKPELSSIYLFQKKEHSLTFVATDSFRLMEKTVPQNNIILENPILIPYKNAIELSRVCDLKSGDPEIKINDNQLALFFSDGVYITSRLITGSFPDYEQIIPKEYASRSLVLKNDLVSVFKKTNVFLNRFLQVVLRFDAKEIVVSASSNDIGDTTESVKAQTDGEFLTLSFNQRYLTEALGHFMDDSLELHLAGIGRPMVIKGVSDKTIRYLVMPMNK